MPERVDTTKINKAIKAELIGKNKLASKPELVTDLNIVLTKEQIETLVKELLTAEDFAGDQLKINGDYCCVDASVGSSVAGPFSSVGSSVSCDPGMPSDNYAKIIQKLTPEKVKVNIMLPQGLKLG